MTAFPLVLFGIYLMFIVIWKLLDLPQGDTLVENLREYFERYGLWAVFAAAFIEGLLLAGNYFPGSFIVFLGVISAGQDAVRALEIVSVASLGFFLAYTIDYVLGRYGWHRLLLKMGLGESVKKAEHGLEGRGLSAILFSYWVPNLAAVTATAAGIIRAPFMKFELFSTFGVVIWNAFWGTLVFALGTAALALTELKYITIAVLVWIAVILVREYVFHKHA